MQYDVTVQVAVPHLQEVHWAIIQGTQETSLLHAEGETDFVHKNTSRNSPFEGVEVYSHKLERGNKETDELIKLINE